MSGISGNKIQFRLNVLVKYNGSSCFATEPQFLIYIIAELGFKGLTSWLNSVICMNILSLRMNDICIHI